MTVFETDRLHVRLATPADVDLIYELWTDPQVMTYVGFPYGLRITREQLLEGYLAWEGDEFGHLLVIELKEDGSTIGQCKMEQPGEDGTVEPDVKLRPAFWGQGYGSEVWKAMVAYEFTYTDCQAVCGSPNVENVASIKMQEGAGMVCVGQGTHEFPESMREWTVSVHAYLYRLSRADWERSKW